MTAVGAECFASQRRVVADIYQRKNRRSVWLAHESYELISHRRVLPGLHGDEAARQNHSAAVRFTYRRVAGPALEFRIVRAVGANEIFLAKERRVRVRASAGADIRRNGGATDFPRAGEIVCCYRLSQTADQRFLRLDVGLVRKRIKVEKVGIG